MASDSNPPAAQGSQPVMSFNSDDLADHAIKPNCWELFLAGERCCCCGCRVPCSCCACWLFFGLGWLFVLMFMREINVQQDKLFNFDGEIIKTDIEVARFHAFTAAKDDAAQGCRSSTMQTSKDTCEKDEACEWQGKGEKGCFTKETCPKPAPKPRTIRMETFIMVYEATEDDGNILDPGLMEHVRKFEKTMLTTANGAVEPWSEYCLRAYPMGTANTSGTCAPPTSFLNAFTMTDSARSTMKQQVKEGYTYVGKAACACTAEDLPCAVCQNGQLKPRSEWPSSVRTCVDARRLADEGTSPAWGVVDGPDAAYRYAEAPLPDVSWYLKHLGKRSLGGDDKATRRLQDVQCQSGGGGGPIRPEVLLALMCSDSTANRSCQWTAPSFGFQCSSTAFFHPTDSEALVSSSMQGAMLSRMCDPTDLNWYQFRTFHFGTNFDCSSKSVKYARSAFFSAYKDTPSEAEEKEFESTYIKGQGGWFQSVAKLEKEVEDESEGRMRIMMFATPVLFSQFLNLLLQDGFLSIGSLFMVWLYMWWTIESLFLALCGIFEILFSLPVAMCLWTVVMRQKISSLQPLVVYMILGIGADDVFIVYDAWQQSALQGPEVSGHWSSRFAWAYRRSFSAMMVTTATTCGSFVIGAFSPLPSVSDFCFFAGVVVFVDWIFCITFFASALVVYERFFKGSACCCRICGMKAPQPGKCLGPGCCWGCCRAMITRGGTDWSKMSKPSSPGEEPQPRAMEKFCSGPLFNFLKGIGGKLCIVFWTIIIMIGIGVSAGTLRTASKPPPIGRDHIDVTKVLEVLINEYPNWRQPKTFAVWGIDEDKPMQEWGAAADERMARHKDSPMEIETPAGQLALLGLCRAADQGKGSDNLRCEDGQTCIIKGDHFPGRCKANPLLWRKFGLYEPDDDRCRPGRHCFMEEFARFWAWNQGDCTAKATSVDCTGDCLWDSALNVCYSKKTEDDYPGLPRAEFVSALGGAAFEQHLLKRKNLESYERYTELTGFTLSPDKSRIKFAFVGWNATYSAMLTVEEANDIYDAWEALYQKHMADYGGFQTTELYIFRATQKEMVKGAILGIFLSLAIALVVMLITTLNWWTSLLGFMNICGIAATFLGFVPLIGWSLGENECIFLIGTVGLSVDYTVHLLHAYNHTQDYARADKARKALGEMGISVISSAFTTLAAAFVLFFCGFYFFFQFGAFIFLVITISILMSLTFMIPVMIIIGPQGDQGRILKPKKAADVPTNA